MSIIILELGQYVPLPKFCAIWGKMSWGKMSLGHFVLGHFVFWGKMSWGKMSPSRHYSLTCLQCSREYHSILFLQYSTGYCCLTCHHSMLRSWLAPFSDTYCPLNGDLPRNAQYCNFCRELSAMFRLDLEDLHALIWDSIFFIHPLKSLVIFQLNFTLTPAKA